MSTESILSIIIIVVQVVQALLIFILGQKFTKQLHTIDRKDKYRLAALDKRLDAHQDAYKVANFLLWTVHDKGEEWTKAQKMYSEFWNNHCLFLTNEARIALQESAHSHGAYDVFLQVWKDNPKDPQAKKDLEERFAKIVQAPDLIMKAIDEETLITEPRTPEGNRITATEIIKTEKRKKR
jgi:hypothetical protein